MSPNASWVDWQPWDVAALRDRWVHAEPSPHVVIDDLLSARALSAIRFAVSTLPHDPVTGRPGVLRSRPITHPALARLTRKLGDPESLAVISAIVGHELVGIDCRSTVYREGATQGPAQGDAGGPVAWILFLTDADAADGGELELLASPGARIEARSNRLVLLATSPDAPHSVRPITRGSRIALTGSFHTVPG